MNSRKKIVITGASGFLGSHLIERLKDDKRYVVYALSSKPEELKAKASCENVICYYKDALEAEMLRNAIVINCAYPRNSTGTAIGDGLRYIQKVFEASVENEATAIINISSQSVYSQQRTEAATGETPVCLESPYAVGKYAVELMLECICRGSKTSYTNLRMASLIGPGFDQRIVNRLIKQALDTGKITVKRNQQRFGFFDVEDAVSAIVLMINSDVKMWKAVYNLGRDGAETLTEIVEIIAEIIMIKEGKRLEISVIEGNELSSSEIDNSQFAIDFGFEASYSIRDSICKIVKKTLD